MELAFDRRPQRLSVYRLKLFLAYEPQLEDTKRLADAEARDRAALFGKFRNLESDLERLREKLEIENEAKADIQKQMSRAIAEAQVYLFMKFYSIV